MTIGDIIDEIISDLGLDSSESTYETKLLGFMKDAIRQLPHKARSRCIITIAYATLSANSQTLSLPSNFVKERMVWRLYGDNNQRVPIDIMTYDKFHAIRTTALGTPNYCHFYLKVIEFNCKSDASYTIEMDYFKDTSGSLATTDTFIGNNEMITAVKDYCKGRYCLDYEEDRTRALDFLALAKDGFDDIDAQYIEQEYPEYVEES